MQFPLRYFENPPATVVACFLRDNGLDFQGLGSRPFRVGENVQLRDVEAVDKAGRLFEAFVGLAAHAHDEVYADEGVGHYPLDVLDASGEEPGVVAAAHEVQHFIAARLQGYVEVGREMFRCGDEVDDFVGQQVGLYRGDAVPVDAFDLFEFLDELKKGLARRLAEVADVHARQDNLVSSLACHAACLLHEVGDAAVAAAPTGKRYRAIGAEIVAAVLHFEEIAGAVAPGA